MHYYQFNIGDYASHTKGLSLLEDLAYRRLIDEYYLHEQPLNMCSADVARRIGMREHEAEVDYVLNRFFDEKDGKWVHKRIEEELDAFNKKVEAKSRAGKASAKARRGAEPEQTPSKKPTKTGNQLTEGQQNSTGVEHVLDSVEQHITHYPLTNTDSDTDVSEAEASKKRLWDSWVALAGEKSRAVLGQHVRDYGEESVQYVVAKTVQAQPVDPISYFKSMFKASPQRDEVVCCLVQIGCDQTDAETYFNSREAVGWKRNNQRIINWQADASAYFANLKKSQGAPGGRHERHRQVSDKLKRDYLQSLAQGGPGIHATADNLRHEVSGPVPIGSRRRSGEAGVGAGN